MSYAPEKTISLLQGVEQVARHPLGEFTSEVGKQLKSAADYIELLNTETRTANQNTALATQTLKFEEEAHRKTRARVADLEVVLQRISDGDKNPKKLAKDALYPPKPKPIDVTQQPVPAN